MKKIGTLLCLLLLVGCFTACENSQSEEGAAQNTSGTGQGANAGGTKTLIAYFSLEKNADYPQNVDATTSASIVAIGDKRCGTTEYVAELIKKDAGGDLHSIQAKTPYPTDYDELVSQNHDEMDKGYLPPLEDSDFNIDDYDTVFLGYPIWATNAPQAIFSFIKEYDLSGKTIIPFCTHDGYGSGSSYSEISKACPKSAMLDGLEIEAKDVPDAESTVKKWLQGLGLLTAVSTGEEAITVTIGEQVLDGVIYDTALAEEIKGSFPLTVAMGSYGGREYYGGIEQTPSSAGEGKLNFENGDITYCKQNNSLAIFYAQTDQPDLTMAVIPIGKVTSDLSVFDDLPDSVDITFDIKN